MFVPTKLLQPYVMKHPSLLDLFVSYKENEVMWILTQIPRQTTQEEEEKRPAQNKDKNQLHTWKIISKLSLKFWNQKMSVCVFVFVVFVFCQPYTSWWTPYFRIWASWSSRSRMLPIFERSSTGGCPWVKKTFFPPFYFAIKVEFSIKST